MMPDVKLIPRSKESIPWGAADRQLVAINLDKYGYEEREYFFSGKANVYSLKEGVAEAKITDAAYTNRFLIRKPKDASTFSGNIVVELLNASNSWDVSPMWCLYWQGLLSDRDVYVGVTVRATCVEMLKVYNPSRYSELSWKNPNPHPGAISEKILMPHHSSPETEDGLVWDILTQLGILLKNETGTEIVGRKVDKVYLTGCSQSAMQLSTYINVFHETDRKSPISPVFDAYLTYSGARMCSLNQEEDPVDVEDEIQITRNCPVPVIRCMTQWDFKDFAGHIKLRREDSDELGDRFRLYELAGQAHNSFFGAFYRPGYDEIEKIGKTTALPPTDYAFLPLEAFIKQNLRNLKDWSRGKMVPAHAQDFIETDENAQELLDEHGNCLGGFRFPQLEVPIARYCSGTKNNPQDSAYIPFSEEKLRALYPTRRAYIDKIFPLIDEMEENRFISIEDADKMKLDILKEAIPYLDHNAR